MDSVVPVAVSQAELGVNAGEECDRHLDYDLAHLMVEHPSGMDEPALHDFSEAGLKQVSTRVTQSLVKQLFSMPSEAAERGRVVQLPPAQLILPRAKPLPKPKPLTKWQQFAKEKGITKQKRSKLVYDEKAQDWKRRHGYGRGNNEADVPIIEASAADQDGEDPFTRLERERKERSRGHKQREVKNTAAAAKAGALPSTVKLSTKLDARSSRGLIAKGQALKGDIDAASRLAGVSTASMGKFDRRLKGEKGSRVLPGQRQRQISATATGEERQMVSKVTGRIMRGSEDLVNIRRAVGNLEASKRHERQETDSADASNKRKKGKAGRLKNRRVPKKKPARAPGGVHKKQGKRR